MIQISKSKIMFFLVGVKLLQTKLLDSNWKTLEAATGGIL